MFRSFIQVSDNIDVVEVFSLLSSKKLLHDGRDTHWQLTISLFNIIPYFSIDLKYLKNKNKIKSLGFYDIIEPVVLILRRQTHKCT